MKTEASNCIKQGSNQFLVNQTAKKLESHPGGRGYHVHQDFESHV